MRMAFALSIAVGLACAIPARVSAQGHQGVPPGQAKRLTQAAAGTHDPSVFPGISLVPRALGSWLDDATVLPPRSTWVTVSTNRWSSPAGRGSDAPIVDVVAGLTPRVHVGVTLPYSRYTDETGSTSTGLGDMYVTAKIVLREPTRGLGVAVAPTLEWSTGLSAFEPGADRTHWVFPVNIELRQPGWRAYGSSGYFTRGALFAAGALERAVTERLSVTGSLTQSWSTSQAAAADAYGLTRRRTDASGAAAYSVSPSLMLFASVSRTLSRLEFDSSRFAINAGASVNLTRR